MRNCRADNAYLSGCGPRQSGFDRRVQTARRRQAHPRHRACRVPALFLRRDGRVFERVTDILPLLNARDSRRPADGDQPAHRVSAQLVPKATPDCAASSQRTFSDRARELLSRTSTRSGWLADADEAITEAEGGAVRYCYVTPKVIITEDRADVADENAQLVFKVCQNMGFDPRNETINAVEAWLGSLPGHGWYDVRRPLVNTQNLADILPLTSIWAGLATNPCPYYAKNTPALCYGATTGSTPFRLNLHVGDTGHTGIYGPTGSGKSVALGAIAANFRAVPDGQIFFFDKGYSAYVLTKALGGQHLDLGEEEVPLCPLARIDDETDRIEDARGLLEDLASFQGVPLVPNQRKALWRALELVARSTARAAHHQ